MNKYVRMMLVLSLITLISGLSLGALNDATFERAANNVLKFKKIPAVADIYETVEGKLEPDVRAAVEEALLADKRYVDVGGEEPMLLFVVKRGDKPHAAAIESFGQGFGGMLGVMVGFELETGNIAGVGITTLSETPGLGTRVTEPAFTDQFGGMSKDTIFKVKKDGGQVDGISGATISSRAVAEAIGQAKASYDKHQDKIRQAATAAPKP